VQLPILFFLLPAWVDLAATAPCWSAPPAQLPVIRTTIRIFKHANKLCYLFKKELKIDISLLVFEAKIN
jgi:hypothetical protein